MNCIQPLFCFLASLHTGLCSDSSYFWGKTRQLKFANKALNAINKPKSTKLGSKHYGVLFAEFLD